MALAFLRRAREALALLRLKPFDVSTPEGRSLERYRRIALTTFSGLAVRGLATLGMLVTTPIVLAYLGKETFGVWTAVTALGAWVALFDLGVAAGLVNCISRAHGREDREEAARYVSTAIAMLTVVALVGGVTFAFVAPFVPWDAVLGATGAVASATAAWSVVAAVALFLLALPFSVAPQIYAGYQRSYAANAFVLVGQGTSLVAVLVAVWMRAPLPALVAAAGLAPLVTASAGFVHATRVAMPWLGPRLGLVSREALRGILSRSLPLFLYQVGALLVNETQILILAHRRDLETVSEYSIMSRLYLIVASVVMLGTSGFVPTFREAYERGDAGWARAAFRRFVHIRLALASGGAAVLLIGGNALVRIWIRRGDFSFPPSVWLTVAVLLYAAVWTAAHAELLSIMDRIWVLVPIVLANGAVAASLTFALAPRWGVLGAVIATAAAPALAFSWILPLVARRVLAPSPRVP